MKKFLALVFAGILLAAPVVFADGQVEAPGVAGQVEAPGFTVIVINGIPIVIPI
jgi:hypothetical protein